MMLTAGFESGSEMTQQIEDQLKANIAGSAGYGGHGHFRYHGDAAGRTAGNDG